MGVTIRPSDLQYRYPRKKETRELSGFGGKPDPGSFDRNNLYEVIPMFEAVMNTLGTDEGRVLHRIEEILNRDIPLFINTREEVYDCLVEVMRDLLAEKVG